MFEWKSRDEWRRLLRYYIAGVFNTAFGFGLYALLVRVGLNIYIAQIISHLIGMAFNYFTYSRYAFYGHSEQIFNYLLSYAVIYLINLGFLAAFASVIKSPYLAGLFATILVSIVNYFILKRFVFKAPAR